jgi:hypothetical protein
MSARILPSVEAIRAAIEEQLDLDAVLLVEDSVPDDVKTDDDWQAWTDEQIDAIEHVLWGMPTEQVDPVLVACTRRAYARCVELFNGDDFDGEHLVLGAKWEFARAFFDGEFEGHASQGGVANAH